MLLVYFALLLLVYFALLPVLLENNRVSIDDIVDSTKNSVNVSCSRIKTAFASKFQDRLASQYYITGRAGEPKRITLDHSLVQDRSGLIMKLNGDAANS